MFDGVVQIVIGVRHMPDVKRNLILLGTLDARGYWYSSQGGALQVFKGSMVIIKGEIFGDFYKFVGNVQMGEDAGRASTSDLRE